MLVAQSTCLIQLIHSNHKQAAAATTRQSVMPEGRQLLSKGDQKTEE